MTPDPDGIDLTAVVDAARRSHRVPITVLAVDPRTPMRAAAHRALLDHEVDGAPTTLAWLLPVGTTPERDALVALVDTWRRSPSAGVIGPKHVDAGDPHVLRALAIRTTRGGRLLSRPAPGEPDQGQYDRSSDALGVPFAGSLVERDLLVALRGWETSFGDVGADLDLGWRAHNAGRRVVVVPAARMRTEAGVAPAGASTASRRRSARRVALARAPWWASPALALWIAVTSVVAALGMLLLKRPRSAWAELSSLASLDPFRGTAARWRTRHRREVSRRDLRALFEPRRSVLTGWADSVHDALVSPRPPIGDEANDLNPRSWLVKVLRHPGVLATAGAAVVAALAGRSLGFGVVTGMGSGLSGGELVGTRADAPVLWHAWTDGWTGAGLGGPDPVGPQTPLLALPTWLVDHVPLLPDPGSAAGFVVARPRRVRDAVRGRQCLPRAAPLGRHPLGAGRRRVRVGDHGGGVGVRGPGPARCRRRARAAAPDRVRAVAAGRPPLDRDQRGRHGAGCPRARRVRPGAARCRVRPGPRDRPGPQPGAGPRPRHRARAGRRARPLVRAPVGGLLAGARRRRRPGPVGRHHARALAARPAQPRRCGRAAGVDRRAARGRGGARPGARPRLGQRGDLAHPPRSGAARPGPRGTRHPARHRPGGRRGGRRADHAVVRRAAAALRPGARAGGGSRARRRARASAGVGSAGAGRRPAHRASPWGSSPFSCRPVVSPGRPSAPSSLRGRTRGRPSRSTRPRAPSPPARCSSSRAPGAPATGSSGARRPTWCARCRRSPTPTVRWPTGSARRWATPRPGRRCSPTPPPTCSPCRPASCPRWPAGSTPPRGCSGSRPATAGTCGG